MKTVQLRAIKWRGQVAFGLNRDLFYESDLLVM